MQVISTGSRALDALLLGGVRRGMLYCVFGASGSGKTQLCMQLALNSARMMDERARVLIVDAKGDFRPERMLEMDEARRHEEGKGVEMDGDANCNSHNIRMNCDGRGDGGYGYDADAVMSIMDRVYVHRAYSVDDIFNSLRDIDHMYSEHYVPLLIVEDTPSLFRLEYGGKSAEGHFRLMRLIHDLALRAVLRKTAVVVTNGITSSIMDGRSVGAESTLGSGERQIMDRSVSMFIHFKVRLERMGRRLGVEGKDGERVEESLFKATLLQPVSRNDSALFRIARMGLVDI